MNMVMNLLSIMIAIIKLSYDGFAEKKIKEITDFNDVIDLFEMRVFANSIRYIDMIVLQMASMTFISRLSAVSRDIFGVITDYIDFTFGSSRIMQVVLISMYNTLAVSVFTTFMFAHYQYKVSNVLYSFARTLLLFINGFYF
jgi:hypothetical protein